MTSRECATRIGREAIDVTSDGLTHILDRDRASEFIEELVTVEREQMVEFLRNHYPMIDFSLGDPIKRGWHWAKTVR